jgi:hypothetical protein
MRVSVCGAMSCEVRPSGERGSRRLLSRRGWRSGSGSLISRLGRGEKLVNMLACDCLGGLDGPILLASDDASSSMVECRSSLLICANGEGDVVSSAAGDEIVAPDFVFVSIDSLGIPFVVA